jgi:hypothetical protein
MGNAVHSTIRESIHSVSYLCINRLLNFVNQNKIEVITGRATWTDLCCRRKRPALSDTDKHLTRNKLLVVRWIERSQV